MVRSLLLSLATLASAYASVIPEITGYSRVSKNGASGAVVGSNARSLNLSPVYKPGNNLKVYNGEVIDYPPTQKYSTLDEEMVAKLDGKASRQQAQDRFHPPASFEHVLAHSNAAGSGALRLQRPSDLPGSSSSLASQSSGSSSSISSGGYATLPQQVYSSNTYQYPDDSKLSKNNDNNNNNNKLNINNSNNHDNLPSITVDGYSMSDDSYSKLPDTYGLKNYKDKKLTSYLDKLPSKPEYQPVPGYIDPDDPYLPNDNDNDNADADHGHIHDLTYPHEYIFDHPPDDFYHHFTSTTTEEPMNDQRLNKRPYSYYYIGKKLWYLPLYFSIYFIIYIAALVLKSVARHKINFPANLAEAAGARQLNANNNSAWSDLTHRVLESIEKFSLHNKNLNYTIVKNEK